MNSGKIKWKNSDNHKIGPIFLTIIQKKNCVFFENNRREDFNLNREVK